MGGLLARVYLARYRPQRLGRVVMLGTPNGGSEIADRLKDFSAYRAFFGPAGQQLGTLRDAAIDAILPSVDYSVGIIAGNRSIYPITSFVLPKPHDGRVSVENTGIDGMFLRASSSNGSFTNLPIASPACTCGRARTSAYQRLMFG